MCIRNVNATVFLCSDISTSNGKVESLIGMYDRIVPNKTDSNDYYIDNFNVALNCSIIFDSKFNESDNCFQLNTEYECMIRLVHVDSGLGTSLLEFPLVVENSALRTWCKDFYEFKRFLQVKKVTLPKGLGNYAIKILFKKKDAPTWTTQTIHSLIIGDSN